MAKLSMSERILIPTYGDPEQIQAGEVVFDDEKCSGCTLCAQACPAKAIVMEDKRPQLKPRGQNECISCGDCVAICPEAAITLTKGYHYTAYYKTIDHGDIQPPRL
jgi:formate hydrogenlyase subunit 6/NADH:ubiquinone oxidoreductase subunit I